jgi:hypothetical protein
MHKQLILAEVKEHYYLTVIVSRLIVIDYFLKEDKIEYVTSILLLCYNIINQCSKTNKSFDGLNTETCVKHVYCLLQIRETYFFSTIILYIYEVDLQLLLEYD